MVASTISAANHMDYQTPQRCALKRKAVPLPDLKGKTVLDVGCDHGWWCREAISLGAKWVLGLDRNREVRGSPVDLIAFNKMLMAELSADFKKINLGKQWREFGKHDVVLCLSMYHHVYQNCADHEPIWFWLWRHTGEVLLWENPTSTDDPVVRLNVSHPYKREEIKAAAEKYFEVEYVGPALHVNTREVWRCYPRALAEIKSDAEAKSGSGGATPAFTWAGGRRIGEIQEILGVRPVPGSLNCKSKFDWDTRYYRAQLLDLVDRKSGLEGAWAYRWARFYPVKADGLPCFALRFEGESYQDDFVELIADDRLRDHLGENFTISR